jgi:hypothetical protein
LINNKNFKEYLLTKNINIENIKKQYEVYNQYDKLKFIIISYYYLKENSESYNEKINIVDNLDRKCSYISKSNKQETIKQHLDLEKYINSDINSKINNDNDENNTYNFIYEVFNNQLRYNKNLLEIIEPIYNFITTKMYILLNPKDPSIYYNPIFSKIKDKVISIGKKKAHQSEHTPSSQSIKLTKSQKKQIKKEKKQIKKEKKKLKKELKEESLKKKNKGRYKAKLKRHNKQKELQMKQKQETTYKIGDFMYTSQSKRGIYRPKTIQKLREENKGYKYVFGNGPGHKNAGPYQRHRNKVIRAMYRNNPDSLSKSLSVISENSNENNS